MSNRYPLWKYLLLAGMILLAAIYSAPNMFGDDPAVQISEKDTAVMNADTVAQVKQVLDSHQISPLLIETADGNILVRFASTDIQLKARDLIKNALGDNYTVALNLASKTPHWLQVIGAHPMKLGLDLRGGVHFLLDVDISAVIAAREEGDLGSITSELRQKDIRYTEARHSKNLLTLQFRDKQNHDKAMALLPGFFPDYGFSDTSTEHTFSISAQLTPAAMTQISSYAVDQNMTILRNRVNELGVSEAIVQRQGQTQISVDLPGIQDTARAKDLIGKTATLRFQLVNLEADPTTGSVPLGSRLYQYENSSIVLKNQVILTGTSITYATATMGEDGRPAVSIRLGGGGETLFNRTTAENIGKLLAIVYVETIPQTQIVDGKEVITHQQSERVISAANIRSALGNSFEITGLSDVKYAQNLALLLRSGALTAPVDFVQERTIGPTLGEANIEKGVMSVVVGSLAVFIFMLCYYRFFGFVADLALIVNMLFIVAILSLLGATLTLPGIAAIVLNVGMAVDANVLIYERIREELRNGMSPQASIHAGYERAFGTIMDSNITTLIVALVLFALGGGAVKGFAIALTIGILSSMITAIFFTRGVVNLWYGRRNVKTLSIGIKNPVHVK